VISVVIPTYNRADMLKHAVDSALSQIYRDFEIIIVDDGSIDDTCSICEKYGSKVRYIRQENQGRGCARNVGILAARGDHIAFLDSDDIWYPDHLERQYDYLRQVPQAEFLHGPLDAMYEDGARYESESKRLKNLFKRAVKKGYTYPNLLRTCLIFSSTVLVKKRLFERVGLYDPGLKMLEDLEWYLRVARTTRIHYLAGPPLASYRYHGNNAFRAGDDAVLGVYLKIFEQNLAELEREGADSCARCEAHLALSFCQTGLNQPRLARRHIGAAFAAAPLRAFRLDVIRRLAGSLLKKKERACV